MIVIEYVQGLVETQALAGLERDSLSIQSVSQSAGVERPLSERCIKP